MINHILPAFFIVGITVGRGVASPWKLGALWFALVVGLDTYLKADVRAVLLDLPLIAAEIAIPLFFGFALLKLEQRTEQLVKLEQAHLLSVAENQRLRIAHELHDVTAQQLASVTVRSRTARRLGDPESILDAATFAGEVSQKALQSMRQIVATLRDPDGAPPLPQPTLSDLARTFETDTPQAPAVKIDIDPSIGADLHNQTELALVRIIQEAVQNVVRHSSADLVEISVTAEGDNVAATVDDNGRGVPSDIPEPTGLHLGLVGMRERARSVGGQLDLLPSPSGGWRVRVVLPFENLNISNKGYFFGPT